MAREMGPMFNHWDGLPFQSWISSVTGGACGEWGMGCKWDSEVKFN
jgi:hypothetical protein